MKHGYFQGFHFWRGWAREAAEESASGSAGRVGILYGITWSSFFLLGDHRRPTSYTLPPPPQKAHKLQILAILRLFGPFWGSQGRG